MNGKIGLGSVGGLFEKPLHLAMNLVASGSGSEDAKQDVRKPLMALFKTVLSGDDALRERDFEMVRHLLRDRLPHEISEMIEMLRLARSISADEVVERLSGLEQPEKNNVLRAALRLAIRSGRAAENHDYLQHLAEGFGMDAGDFAAMEEDLLAQDLRRRKLLRSGAGVLVALIVLGVFVLTATLLRSVIFGLALAYILLPVEQYFERKLANPKSFLFRIFLIFSTLGAPLRNLAQRLRRPGPASAAEQSRQAQQLRITRAVSLTGSLLLLVGLAVLVIVSELSGTYVQRLKVRREAARIEAVESSARSDGRSQTILLTGNEDVNALERAFVPVRQSLENLRSHLDKMPLIQTAIGEVSHMLHDSAAQRELAKMALQRTGGVVSFTTSVLGAFVNLLADLLLTIFFFLLFLNKLAFFCAGNAGAGRRSEYLVRTVFNGNWLPGAKEETISEAERIISEIINKLKVWLRGYVTLVLIDGTVYTTVFYFLDVPYFFVLGPL
ncbi:MAG: hypothetical protein J6R85_06230, partial [Lentisphaeria bacterium]|nr:hypothetical protein [Lentisphaeria bacterium]